MITYPEVSFTEEWKEGRRFEREKRIGIFEEFVTQLKAKAFSDKGIEMGFVKFVDALVKEVNVLKDES